MLQNKRDEGNATEMEKKRMDEDKFIELDVKKLKQIESERKKLLSKVMQESPGIHFMCCPRCSYSLNERIVSDTTIFLCKQCGGSWIDKKSISKVLRLSGDRIKSLLAQL